MLSQHRAPTKYARHDDLTPFRSFEAILRRVRSMAGVGSRLTAPTALNAGIDRDSSMDRQAPAPLL